MIKLFQPKYTEENIPGRPGFKSQYVFEVFKRVVKKYGRYSAISITARKLYRDHTTIRHHLKRMGYYDPKSPNYKLK